MSFKTTSLVLIKRHAETEDTESFYFQTKEASPLNFKPGQFILLSVTINNTTQVRAYSISSQPNNQIIQLTIKRVNNGLVSNWLIDHLQPNQEVLVHDIAGEFNIIDRPYRQKILFISAGCGITPVFSMANYLLNHQNDIEIDFLHCAKDEDNIIYDAKLPQLAELNTQFHYHLRLKKRISTQALDCSSVGRVTPEFLSANYNRIQQYTIFLCGSQRFMQDIAQSLNTLGFDMAHFYHESFHIESTNATHINSHPSVTVSIPSFDFEQTVPYDENLLHILESGQLPIIGACRAGVCGSCKCKIEHGEVESTSTATLTPQEIEQGYRLACSSKVKTDVRVSLF